MRLAQIVLALLSLLAFRSPFVGSLYAYLGTMWLLTLLAAEGPTAKRRAAWLVGFGLLAATIVLIPSPGPPPNQVPPAPAWLVATSVAYMATLVLNLGVVVRVMMSAWREREATAPLGAAMAARAGVGDSI
jgi:hypothetical protein